MSLNHFRNVLFETAKGPNVGHLKVKFEHGNNKQ